MAPTTGNRAVHRVRLLLALLVAGAAVMLGPASGARALGDEGMERFVVQYDLQRDGSVQVRETITWRFPSGEERHGIFRNIVVRMGWNDEPGRYRYYDLTDVVVSSPSGAPADFRVTDSGAAKEIRIGHPDRWTSGTQVYELRYTLHNVLNPIAADGSASTGGTAAPADTVEFHYNVFGPDETTERAKVNVVVNAPAASTQVACYDGPVGGPARCQAQAGNPSTFEAMGLGSGEPMTVIAGYPASAFGTVAPDVREGDTEGGVGPAAAPAANTAAVLAGVGAPILALGVMGALVWTRGRDERYADVTPGLTPSVTDPSAAAQVTTRGGTPVVAVQFHPPHDVPPGLVGVILDETANPIDVSATLIDLAVRGYLRIEETKSGAVFKRTDWTLTRLEPPANDTLLPYERQLLDGVFSSRGDTVALSELKNHFASTLKSIQKQMYDEVVTRHWFRSSPERQRGAWQALGVAIAVGGGLMLFYGRGAVQALLGGAFTGGLVLGLGLVVAGIIVWLLGSRMAAKTAEGSAIHAQSLGFKEYLVTAEAGQIAFDEASNVFSRYLPYAVVFGVADRWAKVFADVARAAEAAGQSIMMPTWYVWTGSSMPDFGSIADGVDSFSTTSTGTFTSTPGSSGSSGFSGGGGFSGSGGGGSSSGSW